MNVGSYYDIDWTIDIDWEFLRLDFQELSGSQQVFDFMKIEGA